MELGGRKAANSVVARPHLALSVFSIRTLFIVRQRAVIQSWLLISFFQVLRLRLLHPFHLLLMRAVSTLHLIPLTLVPRDQHRQQFPSSGQPHQQTPLQIQMEGLEGIGPFLICLTPQMKSMAWSIVGYAWLLQRSQGQWRRLCRRIAGGRQCKLK
jgi:hypothetical protein